jgi:predicted transcriptional regulator
MLDLDALRKAAGVTQVAMAAALGLTQGAVSKIGRQDDWMLSTLGAYLDAIDAEAELVIRVNGQTIVQPLTRLKIRKKR